MQYCVLMGSLFTKRRILDSSKLEEFVDNDFRFDESGSVFQTGKKHGGNRRIAR